MAEQIIWFQEYQFLEILSKNVCRMIAFDCISSSKCWCLQRNISNMFNSNKISNTCFVRYWWWRFTLYHSLLQSFRKFCWTVSEELRWQEKQDWLTDWLTDGSKTLYPPQLVAWGIIGHQITRIVRCWWFRLTDRFYTIMFQTTDFLQKRKKKYCNKMNYPITTIFVSELSFSYRIC